MELLNPTSFDVIAIYAVLAAFAYLAWARPLWGVYLIAALLPSYLIRPTIGGLPTTVLELLILILFGVWLIKDQKWRRIRLPWSRSTGYNPVPRSFSAPLSLLLVGAFIGMLLSPNGAAAFGILKAYFIEPVLFLIVLVYEVRREREMQNLMYILGGLTIVIGAIAIWQADTGLGIPNPFWQALPTRRVTTIFGYPNASALLVAPIIAWFVGWVTKVQGRHEGIFASAVIVMGMLTIVTAKSSGALVGVGVASLMVIWFVNKKIGSALVLIAAMALVGIILTNSMHINAIGGRIANNYLDLSSTSLEIRVNQWRETLALLADNPFFGAGLSNYQNALAPYHRYDFLEIYLYPHNILLNFWVETGLLGLISATWLILVCFKKLFEKLKHSGNKDPHALAFIATWTALIIHGLVDVPYFKNDLGVLFMTLVGLTILLSNNYSRVAKE